jgi:Uma2 family endonuclease
MASTATKIRMTVEELERNGAPEGRWELIDGELVEMAPSDNYSSKIGNRFGRHLGNFVEPRGLGEVFDSSGGFRVVVAGVEMVRVPDAAFVSAERVPKAPKKRGFYRLAPDLVVEVVSPSDRASDVLAKVQMWLDAGARLVWVADPDTRTITVTNADRSSHVLREGDELTGGDVLPEFVLPVSALFD